MGANVDAGYVEMGDVYRGFSTSQQLDYVQGTTYDTELLLRISAISPRAGSLAGGSDLTVYGTGFGSNLADVHVTAAGAPCTVTAMQEGAVLCRVASAFEGHAADDGASSFVLPAAAISTSFPGERGVRWSWASGSGAGGGNAAGEMLLPSFQVPIWSEIAGAGSTTRVEGWFEPPQTANYTFLLRLDGASSLRKPPTPLNADPNGTSHRIASHRIASHRIASHRIASHLDDLP